MLGLIAINRFKTHNTQRDERETKRRERGTPKKEGKVTRWGNTNTGAQTNTDTTQAHKSRGRKTCGLAED